MESFSYSPPHQPQSELMGKAKETKLGGFCLGLGRSLKVRRETAQLFFPGEEGK